MSASRRKFATLRLFRTLTVLAIVTGIAAPAVGAPTLRQKEQPARVPVSSLDAAAVQASLLAFREHVEALRKRRARASNARALVPGKRYRLVAQSPQKGPGARVPAPPRLVDRIALPADAAQRGVPPLENAARNDVITLATLEQYIDRAPETLLALSGARSASARITSLHSHRGPEFTLSGSAGTYRELVTDTLVRNYTGTDLRVGVRVPLFGASAGRHALDELGDELTTKQFDVNEARLGVLRELRERYVDYWTLQRKLDLTSTYLKSASEVASAVAIRVRSGLTLEGEGLQALAGYDLAKENMAHFARDASSALNAMRRLTDRDLPDFKPVFPAPADGCRTQAQFVRAALDASPGLALLREQLDRSRRLAARPASALQGTMTVSQGMVAQQGAPTTGRSTTLGIDLALPFDAASAVAAEREVDTARADEIAARLKYETERLRSAAEDAWSGMREAEVALHVARTRVGTSRELTREGLLRYGSMAGSTVEALQASRLGYYRSVLDNMDADSQLAKRRMVAFSPSGCATGATVRHDAAPSTPTGRQNVSVDALRVYAWNSRDLLGANWSEASFWERFITLGIRRVMLSLDAAQIGEVGNALFHTRLQRFVAAGDAAGVNVDLLLGEPHWILPDQRSRLVSIVSALSDVPFHALELDLEPSQIAAETRLSTQELQSKLIETLRSVGAVSAWPLSLSANYRDFATISSEANGCYACSLKASGVQEIVLMTYVTNADRAAELVRPILRAAPALSFAIAQSVEPALSFQESYRMHSRPQFLSAMSHLTRLLAGEGNFSGIAIQSYLDYTAMQP